MMYFIQNWLVLVFDRYPLLIVILTKILSIQWSYLFCETDRQPIVVDGFMGHIVGNMRMIMGHKDVQTW